MAQESAVCAADSLCDNSNENASIKLNVTRNPFDSNLCDKENFPTYSPSMLIKVDTPIAEVGFRWSIDHIATMQPTEIEEFPNQEYSSSYERKEDEERDQQAIDEYFSKVTLPSPWLTQKGCYDLKRVTFSPHPPATRIIHEANDSTTSIESIEHTGVTFLADACCQTTLTIPVDCDFESLLGKHMFSYFEQTGEAKKLLMSSLRRKLFDLENTPACSKRICKYAVSELADGPTLGRSTPVYITSSPRKGANAADTSVVDDRCMRFEDGSPPLSPLVDIYISSPECSPKQASNIGSSGQRLSLASVDMSPVTACDENSYTSFGNFFLYKYKSEQHSPVGMSFEAPGNAQCKTDRGETSGTRMLATPDLSPIKDDISSTSWANESSANQLIMPKRADVQKTSVEAVRKFTASESLPALARKCITLDVKHECALPTRDVYTFNDLIAKDREFVQSASTLRLRADSTPRFKDLSFAVTPLKGILKKREHIHTPGSPGCVSTEGVDTTLYSSSESVSNLKVRNDGVHRPSVFPCGKQSALFRQDSGVNEKDTENGKVLTPSLLPDGKTLQWIWRDGRSLDEGNILIDSVAMLDLMSTRPKDALGFANCLQSSIDMLEIASEGSILQHSNADTAKCHLNSTELPSCESAEISFSVECPSEIAFDKNVTEVQSAVESSEEMRRNVCRNSHSTSPVIPLALLSLHSNSCPSYAAHKPPLPSRRSIYRSYTWPWPSASDGNSLPLLRMRHNTSAVPRIRSSFRQESPRIFSARDLDWDTFKDYTSIRKVYGSYLPSPFK